MQTVMNTIAQVIDAFTAPSEHQIAKSLQRVEYPRETVGYVATLLKDAK